MIVIDGLECQEVPHKDKGKQPEDATARDLLKLWGLSIGLVAVTFVLYSLLLIIPSIPSRWATGPGSFAVNEGGRMCFAPNSTWLALRSQPVVSIEDAVSLGGMSVKSRLTFGDGQLQSIWKPQLKIRPGRRSSPFNAVIAFHLDCLMGFQRTVPAASLALDWQAFHASVSEVAQARLVGSTSLKRWEKSGHIFGVAQQFYRPAVHMNFLVFGTTQTLQFLGIEETVERWLGASDFTARERGQRDMFDFLLGNWDRSHNRFYAVDPATGRSSYVFLDNDNFLLSTTAKTALSDGLQCRFFREDVQRLAELTSRGLSRLVEQSLEQEDLFPAGLSGKRKSPVKFLDLRASYFLDHVARCIDDFGEHAVLGP